MLNQLRIENYRAKRFVPLYVFLGLIIALLLYTERRLFVMGRNLPDLHSVFAESVQDVSLIFFIAILGAWFVGIDFSNRTIQRSVVTGCSRFSVVISRLLPSCAMAVIFHLCFVFSDMLGLGIQAGFSFKGFTLTDLAWLLVVLLQVTALESVFVFITFVCGNVYSAITASVAVDIVACNIMRNYFPAGIYRDLCFCFADNCTKERLILCSVFAIITIIVMITATTLVFRKKDF